MASWEDGLIGSSRGSLRSQLVAGADGWARGNRSNSASSQTVAKPEPHSGQSSKDPCWCGSVQRLEMSCLRRMAVPP